MSQKIESIASPIKVKERTSRSSLKGSAASNNADVVSTHGTPMSISPEDRQRMISDAAYYLAEKRAFNGECQLEDWLAAEAEINARFPVQ